MDQISVLVTGITLITGLFLYENKYTYWVVMAGIFLVIINVYLISVILRRIFKAKARNLIIKVTEKKEKLNHQEIYKKCIKEEQELQLKIKEYDSQIQNVINDEQIQVLQEKQEIVKQLNGVKEQIQQLNLLHLQNQDKQQQVQERRRFQNQKQKNNNDLILQILDKIDNFQVKYLGYPDQQTLDQVKQFKYALKKYINMYIDGINAGLVKPLYHKTFNQKYKNQIKDSEDQYIFSTVELLDGQVTQDQYQELEDKLQQYKINRKTEELQIQQVLREKIVDFLNEQKFEKRYTLCEKVVNKKKDFDNFEQVKQISDENLSNKIDIENISQKQFNDNQQENSSNNNNLLLQEQQNIENNQQNQMKDSNQKMLNDENQNINQQSQIIYISQDNLSQNGNQVQEQNNDEKNIENKNEIVNILGNNIDTQEEIKSQQNIKFQKEENNNEITSTRKFIGQNQNQDTEKQQKQKKTFQLQNKNKFNLVNENQDCDKLQVKKINTLSNTNNNDQNYNSQDQISQFIYEESNLSEIKQFLISFKLLEGNNSGKVSKRKMVQIMSQIGITVNKGQIDEIFDLFDSQQDEVDFVSFLSRLLKQKYYKQPLELLREIFSRFDFNSNGVLEQDEIEVVAKTILTQQFSQSVYKEFVHQEQRMGENGITFYEFTQLIL